eukprot:scaffold3221_cov166-Skeletonema_menzelii.AAC.1
MMIDRLLLRCNPQWSKGISELLDATRMKDETKEKRRLKSRNNARQKKRRMGMTKREERKKRMRWTATRKRLSMKRTTTQHYMITRLQ